MILHIPIDIASLNGELHYRQTWNTVTIS